MAKEIKTDEWGKQIWSPVDYPFVVRSTHQSSVAGNFGWATINVGFAYETYEEARAIADKPMGMGEMSREVCQAVNAETWQKNGKWHIAFRRKRGNKITEPGPLK